MWIVNVRCCWPASFDARQQYASGAEDDHSRQTAAMKHQRDVAALQQAGCRLNFLFRTGELSSREQGMSMYTLQGL